MPATVTDVKAGVVELHPDGVLARDARRSSLMRRIRGWDRANAIHGSESHHMVCASWSSLRTADDVVGEPFPQGGELHRPAVTDHLQRHGPVPSLDGVPGSVVANCGAGGL